MPELIFDTQDAVPEPIRSIATEKDGKWAVNVVPKAELDDFRNRNIEISRDRDNLTSVIGRLTTDLEFNPESPDEFISSVKDLRDIKQQVDDGKLVKDTSLAQALETKTGEMKRTYESQVNGLKTENTNFRSENEKLKRDLARSIVDREVMLAVSNPESGALPEATRQIMREAYDVYTVDENNKLVPKDKDGNIIYGSDGATPMAPSEWLKKLQEASPFFFKSANGGGAGGGAGGNGGTLSQAQLDAMSPEEKMNYGRQHNLNGNQR
jgi:hypothetical protein